MLDLTPFIALGLGATGAMIVYFVCHRLLGTKPHTKKPPKNLKQSDNARTLPEHFLFAADKMSNIAPLRAKNYPKLNKQLTRAGLSSIKPSIWRGFQIISVLVFGLIGLFVGLATKEPLLIGSLIGTLFGAVLPHLALKHLVKERQRRIEAEVANILEELSIAVKSGYSVERGIRLIGTEMTGALADEFKRADTDINSLGMDFTRAMKSLAQRCGCAAVDSFCAALIQARTQGTSISRVLESQAKLARQERATQQMEEVNKLPGKLVAPVFGIMMLIIVLCLVPPIYNMIGVFGSAWSANGAGAMESLSSTTTF